MYCVAKPGKVWESLGGFWRLREGWNWDIICVVNFVHFTSSIDMSVGEGTQYQIWSNEDMVSLTKYFSYPSRFLGILLVMRKLRETTRLT